MANSGRVSFVGIRHVDVHHTSLEKVEATQDLDLDAMPDG